MARPDPENDSHRELFEIIDRYGWCATCVEDNEGDGPNFSYSTGIFERTGKPELITFGFSHDVGHWLINEYGRRLVAGESFEPGIRYGGFLNGHDVIFLAVTDRSVAKEYACWSDWYYNREPFPLWQLVGPDSRTGAFPWEPACREFWRKLQPVLGDRPQLAS